MTKFLTVPKAGIYVWNNNYYKENMLNKQIILVIRAQEFYKNRRTIIVYFYQPQWG